MAAPQESLFLAAVTMKDSISAIIINFRADEHVRRLTKELNQQTYLPLETLIIDNSDGSRGFGEGCNLGAKEAKGKYLLFLNPDVSLPPKFIETLFKATQSGKNRSLVGSQVRRPNGKIEITASAVPGPLLALVEFSFLKKLPFLGTWAQKTYRLDNFNHTSSRTVPCLAACAWLMKVEDFWQIGGFDENLFLYFEEFDVCSRLHMIGKGVYFCAETSLTHFGQASTSQISGEARKHFLHSRTYWMHKAYGMIGDMIAWFLTMSEKIKHV